MRSVNLFLAIALLGILLIAMTMSIEIHAYPLGGYDWGSKVDPEVVKELSKSGRARVLIMLENSSAQGGVYGLELRGSVLVRALMALADSSQSGVVDKIKASGAVIEDRLWLVNAVAATVDPQSLRIIAGLDSVKRIVMDRVYKLVDPVDRVYDPGLIRPQDNASRRVVQADAVESMGITGRGVRVAVIDTGIQVDHPWLIRRGSSVVTAEYDATGTGVVHVCTYLGIPAEHGTHVAGIIASQNDTHRGVAPGVDIYNVIVFSNVTQCEGAFSTWIIRGIQWALLGPDGVPGTGDEADIISMSLGALEPPWFTYYFAKYDPLLTAMSRAVASGAVVVVAAGNDGPGGYTINELCLASGVICVGAVDARAGSISRASVAIFSSRGPLPFDIAAPDVAAPGVGVVSSIPVNRSAAFSGTSMATPHVSGVAALLKQAHPGWGPLDIKMAIVVSASPAPLSDIYGSPNPFEQGTGVVRALDALKNPLRLSFPSGVLQGESAVLVAPPGSRASTSLSVGSVGDVNFSVIPVNLDSTDLVDYMGVNVIRRGSIGFSQQYLSITPGSSTSITITVSIPPSTPPGTYAGYITASTGDYVARLPIVVVVPASLREDAVSFSASISTMIGAGPPEWVVFRLYVPQPVGDLVYIASYSEGPLPLAVYAITPSNRFVASVSGLRLSERGEYILILEVTGFYAVLGNATITLSAPKISQGLSQVGELRSNVSSLESGLGAVNESLTQRSNALETSIEGLRESLQIVNESLRVSQQQIDLLNRSLTSLAQRVSENTRSISNLSSSLQEFINNTLNRFSSIEDTISSLNEILANQQRSILEIRGNISTLAQDLGNTAIASAIGIALAITGIAIGALTLARSRKKQ